MSLLLSFAYRQSRLPAIARVYVTVLPPLPTTCVIQRTATRSIAITCHSLGPRPHASQVWKFQKIFEIFRVTFWMLVFVSSRFPMPPHRQAVTCPVGVTCVSQRTTTRSVAITSSLGPFAMTCHIAMTTVTGSMRQCLRTPCAFCPSVPRLPAVCRSVAP